MFKKKRPRYRSNVRANERLRRLRESVFDGAGPVPQTAEEAHRRLAAHGDGTVLPQAGAALDMHFDDSYTYPEAHFEDFEAVEDNNNGNATLPDDAHVDPRRGRDRPVPEDGNLNQRKANCVEDVAVYFASMQARRDVPIRVMSDIIGYVKDNQELIGPELPSFRQMRANALQTVPTVLHDVVCSRPDGAKVSFLGKPAFPKKAVKQQQLRLDYVLYYTSLHQVIKLHGELHPHGDPDENFDMSLDGIPENKSSGLSIDILSIKFTKCRTVYTIAVLQPARKAMQLPDSITLKHFLEEYHSCGKRLRYVIADAPKRAALQGLKQHSASFACPYCKAQKKNKVYPADSVDEPLRSNEEIRLVAEQAAAGEDDEEVLQGVKQPSPLAVIDIDLVRHIPAERMHMIDLGIVRKIMQLSFKCATYKGTDVPFMRSNDAVLNKILATILCLPDFARRTRPLDLGNYKAEEYRNLATCFWPAVADAVPREVCVLWLVTVFIVRAMVLPETIYEDLTEYYDMKTVSRRWYSMFQSVFTAKHCSYYVHVFGAHVLEVRALGPLTETSAYLFEGHYNIMKRSYRAGTPSTGQQAMKNSLLATKYSHPCKKKKTLTAKKTERIDDTYAYMKSGSVVEATSEVTDGFFTGRAVPVDPAFYPIPGYDFNRILAFKRSRQRPKQKELTYPLSDVVGKCVVVGDVISVMPWNLLLET